MPTDATLSPLAIPGLAVEAVEAETGVGAVAEAEEEDGDPVTSGRAGDTRLMTSACLTVGALSALRGAPRVAEPANVTGGASALGPSSFGHAAKNAAVAPSAATPPGNAVAVARTSSVASLGERTTFAGCGS